MSNIVLGILLGILIFIASGFLAVYWIAKIRHEAIHLFRLKDGTTLAEAVKQADHNTTRVKLPGRPLGNK